jgi:hypothetical protein
MTCHSPPYHQKTGTDPAIVETVICGELLKALQRISLFHGYAWTALPRKRVAENASP